CAGRRHPRTGQEGRRGGRRGVDGRRVRVGRAHGGGDQPAPVPRTGDHARQGADPRRRLPTSLEASESRVTHSPLETGRPLLRIAVPNKGSLAEPASQMLVEAGYRQRSDSRELVLLDAENDTEFFFLRPRDIAVYVGSGQLDVGITGEDLLLDSGARAEPIMPLGFAGSTFRFAAIPGTVDAVGDLHGKRIATA